MENPRDVVTIAQMLSDSDAPVRAAAARAITQCLWHAADQPEAVKLAETALEQQSIAETDSDAKDAIYEAIGSFLCYGPTDDVTHIDLLLRTPIMPVPIAPGGKGALLGLEALTRRLPGIELNVRTIARLRELAVAGIVNRSGSPQISALQTLHNIRDDDAATINLAAMTNCDSSPDPICGFEFRLIGLQMISAVEPRYADAMQRARRDAAWQVRYEALSKTSEIVTKTHSCALLIDALDDRVDFVARHAIELLSPSCVERDDLTKRLTELAGHLGDGSQNARWQLPLAALEALITFSPDVAHKIVKEVAATHDLWQVRAGAARLAGTFFDEDLAIALAQHNPGGSPGVHRGERSRRRAQGVARDEQQGAR